MRSGSESVAVSVSTSGSALIVGSMALVLAQTLNPSGSNESPATVLEIAGNESARWLAMSVLFFAASVGLVLGMPSVLSLFTGRGRRLGFVGVGLFTVGAIGLTGLSALMLIFRALSLAEAVRGKLLDDVLDDAGMQIMLGLWVYSFLGGVLLLTLALFRAKSTPPWVPGLLVVFLALQAVSGIIDSAGRVTANLGLVAFVASLTGMAIAANSPSRHRPAED